VPRRIERRCKEAIEDEILFYLSRHPAANDTLEGVAQWWLAESAVHRATSEVRAALDRLVGSRQVVAYRQPDGRVRYCAAAKQGESGSGKPSGHPRN